LNTLLDRCSDYADGTQDATDLAKFCNEMIGLSNSIALGDIMTLRLQRDALKAEVEQFRKDKERLDWLEANSLIKVQGSVPSTYEDDKTLRQFIDAAMDEAGKGGVSE
jgi:hypothetical protein